MKFRERLIKYTKATGKGLLVVLAFIVIGFFESLITKSPSLITSFALVLACLWMVWRTIRFIFGMFMLYASNGKRF